MDDSAVRCIHNILSAVIVILFCLICSLINKCCDGAKCFENGADGDNCRAPFNYKEVEYVGQITPSNNFIISTGDQPLKAPLYTFLANSSLNPSDTCNSCDHSTCIVKASCSQTKICAPESSDEMSCHYDFPIKMIGNQSSGMDGAARHDSPDSSDDSDDSLPCASGRRQDLRIPPGGFCTGRNSKPCNLNELIQQNKKTVSNIRNKLRKISDNTSSSPMGSAENEDTDNVIYGFNKKNGIYEVMDENKGDSINRQSSHHSNHSNGPDECDKCCCNNKPYKLNICINSTKQMPHIVCTYSTTKNSLEDTENNGRSLGTSKKSCCCCTTNTQEPNINVQIKKNFDEKSGAASNTLDNSYPTNGKINKSIQHVPSKIPVAITSKENKIIDSKTENDLNEKLEQESKKGKNLRGTSSKNVTGEKKRSSTSEKDKEWTVLYKDSNITQKLRSDSSYEDVGKSVNEKNTPINKKSSHNSDDKWSFKKRKSPVKNSRTRVMVPYNKAKIRKQSKFSPYGKPKSNIFVNMPSKQKVLLGPVNYHNSKKSSKLSDSEASTCYTECICWDKKKSGKTRKKKSTDVSSTPYDNLSSNLQHIPPKGLNHTDRAGKRAHEFYYDGNPKKKLSYTIANQHTNLNNTFESFEYNKPNNIDIQSTYLKNLLNGNFTDELPVKKFKINLRNEFFDQDRNERTIDVSPRITVTTKYSTSIEQISEQVEECAAKNRLIRIRIKKDECNSDTETSKSVCDDNKDDSIKNNENITGAKEYLDSLKEQNYSPAPETSIQNYNTSEVIQKYNLNLEARINSYKKITKETKSVPFYDTSKQKTNKWVTDFPIHKNYRYPVAPLYDSFLNIYEDAHLSDNSIESKYYLQESKRIAYVPPVCPDSAISRRM